MLKPISCYCTSLIWSTPAPCNKHLASDLSHSTFKDDGGLPIWATPSTGPHPSLISAWGLHVPFRVGRRSGHWSWTTYFNSVFDFSSWVGVNILKSHLTFILWLQNIHFCLSILTNSSIWPLLHSRPTRMWKVKFNFIPELFCPFHPCHLLLTSQR